MIIKTAHGSGGAQSGELINKVILKYFGNATLNLLQDAALLKNPQANIAFTTDSFVVNPLFFSGGCIGDLAICGTVNDLSARGAIPKYLSVSFIIEEGFKIEDFKKILAAMARRAKEAGIQIVTGDTKVVEKGKADGIFINTAGIGIMQKGANLAAKNIKAGDMVLISGALGGHSVTIMNARHNLGIKSNIKTDSAPLNKITQKLISALGADIKFMRDITRGGLATILNEVATQSKKGFEVLEEALPSDKQTTAAAELLGLDLLCAANEGKMMFIINPKKAQAALKIIRSFNYGKGAAIIGQVTKAKQVKLITKLKTARIIKTPQGEILPRIC